MQFEYKPLHAILPPKLKPILLELAEVFYETLADSPLVVEAGGRELAAANLAREIMAAVAQRMGGSAIYLTKDIAALVVAPRDHAMWQRFTGHNLRQLAREYGISDVRAWQIINEQRRLERERRQMSLPFS